MRAPDGSCLPSAAKAHCHAPLKISKHDAGSFKSLYNLHFREYKIVLLVKCKAEVALVETIVTVCYAACVRIIIGLSSLIITTLGFCLKHQNR